MSDDLSSSEALQSAYNHLEVVILALQRVADQVYDLFQRIFSELLDMDIIQEDIMWDGSISESESGTKYDHRDV